MSEKTRTVLTPTKRQIPVLLPDRAGVNRTRLEGGGRNQPSVGTSATGHGLRLSARATGLKRTQSGVSLEDDAERGEGGMRREGSMHHPVSIQ